MGAVLGTAGPVPAVELPAEVVSELVGAGLLDEFDGMVCPTPAAVHYGELLDFARSL